MAYALADQIHQEAYLTLTDLQACQGHACRAARNAVEARNPPFIIGKCQTYPLPLKKSKTKLNPWDTITP